jgi:glycosyltransferase involved in cell wall biosynthesis
MDAWMAKRCGAKVILHIHGAQFDECCRTAGAIARRFVRWVLESVDRVVALSDFWRDVLVAVAPRANVVVIPNAVAVGPMPDRAGRDGPCRFLLLAKMDEWKGIHDLLLACASVQYSNVAFDLVLAGPPGSAGDASTLPQRITELELSDRVVYVGPVAGERKAELLAWADVYVQPSHHEGLPLSVLEAMASGLPVIATSVGALPEVVDEGIHGRLVAPGRPDQLATTMMKVALDSTRGKMGQAGQKRVKERFSLAGFQDRLEAMYASLEGSAPRLRAGTVVDHPSVGGKPGVRSFAAAVET